MTEQAIMAGFNRSKKAAVASTLTWIVATVIIFFIMAVYFVFIGIMYASGESGSKISVTYDSPELLITRTLIGFLEMPVDFEGKTIQAYQLVADFELNDENEKRFEKFKELAQIFVDKNFVRGEKSAYEGAGVRIYSAEEKIFSSEYERKYSGYSAQTKSGSALKFLCDNSPPARTSTAVYISGTKKVALCVEYEQYVPRKQYGA